jgi:hypothetical protein
MTSYEQIQKALSFIPAHDRDTWLRMGMAIKSELGEGGFSLWDEWSRTADNYKSGDARDVWRSIEPNGGVTIGSLFHEAKANSYRGDGGNVQSAPRKEPKADGAGKSEWTPILPIPVDAPPPLEKHPTFGKPVMIWTYRDKDGQPLLYVYRFNKADGSKETRPLSFCKNGDAYAWRWQGLPKPRPLYNLDQLTANPIATVIICEGEKSADAAGRLFPLPDHVATTSPNMEHSRQQKRTGHTLRRVPCGYGLTMMIRDGSTLTRWLP